MKIFNRIAWTMIVTLTGFLVFSGIVEALNDVETNEYTIVMEDTEPNVFQEVAGTERRNDAIAVRVQLICDIYRCGGFMELCDGGVLTSYPAQYPHKCTKCENTRYISGKVYPYIEYKF